MERMERAIEFTNERMDVCVCVCVYAALLLEYTRLHSSVSNSRANSKACCSIPSERRLTRLQTSVDRRVTGIEQRKAKVKQEYRAEVGTLSSLFHHLP